MKIGDTVFWYEDSSGPESGPEAPHLEAGVLLEDRGENVVVVIGVCEECGEIRKVLQKRWLLTEEQRISEGL
jgi:hypothetical protein